MPEPLETHRQEKAASILYASQLGLERDVAGSLLTPDIDSVSHLLGFPPSKGMQNGASYDDNNSVSVVNVLLYATTLPTSTNSVC